jgi:hypothetical protein
MRHFSLKKFLRLNFHCAMSSAGAGIGKGAMEEEVKG